jgi:hypothetical protein
MVLSISYQYLSHGFVVVSQLLKPAIRSQSPTVEKHEKKYTPLSSDKAHSRVSDASHKQDPWKEKDPDPK